MARCFSPRRPLHVGAAPDAQLSIHWSAQHLLPLPALSSTTQACLGLKQAPFCVTIFCRWPFAIHPLVSSTNFTASTSSLHSFTLIIPNHSPSPPQHKLQPFIPSHSSSQATPPLLCSTPFIPFIPSHSSQPVHAPLPCSTPFIPCAASEGGQLIASLAAPHCCCRELRKDGRADLQLLM